MPANRKIGDWTVPAVGLGCMNLSHAYGVPPSEAEAVSVLEKAIDLGIKHFDTAALYGFGRNESLVGPFLKKYRADILLASKCGMRGENGKRVIDGRPEKLRADIEGSLRRLDTDVIDLYYLHRVDLATPVPVEDSVGEMSRMVEEGKVRTLGLSEVSAETLRRAQAVHPITAVQSEYSPWSRNVEIGVLDACAALDIAFVAFSPLARGFLTAVALTPDTFSEKDIRRGMPRFQEPHLSANQRWLEEYQSIAKDAGCSTAQLTLAWVLSRRENIHVIPGTTSPSHLTEDFEALGVSLSQETIDRIDALVTPTSVSGPRYPAATQKEIDTEEFTQA